MTLLGLQAQTLEEVGHRLVEDAELDELLWAAEVDEVRQTVLVRTMLHFNSRDEVSVKRC